MARPEFLDRFITVSGLQLHYVDWGPQNRRAAGRPVMLLLHGVTGHARLWDHIARAFRQEYHVLALDQRGHGDSDWSPEGEYESTDLAADLAAFYTQLGLGDTILVGASWGGLVGLIHAAGYPHTVRKLVMVDIGLEFDRPETAIPDRPIEFESEQALEIYERRANPFPALWTLRPGWQAGVCERDGKLIRKHDPIFTRRWPFRNMSYWHYARQVACPTLLLRGAESFVLSPELAARTAQTIQNCHLVEIADAGHPIHLDNPPAFEAAVRKFLNPRQKLG